MAPRTPKVDPTTAVLDKLAAALTPKTTPDKMKSAELLTAWDADPKDEAIVAEVESRTGGWYVANTDNSVSIPETVEMIALHKRGETFKGVMWGDKPIRKVADRASGSSQKVRFNPYRPTNSLTPSGFDPALNITFPITDMATMVKHSYVAMALDKAGAVLSEDDIADIAEEVQGTRTPRRSVKRALAEMALAEADDDPDNKIAAAKRRLTHGAERPFVRDNRDAAPTTVTTNSGATTKSQAAEPSRIGKLTGEQFQQVQNALLSAFPTPSALAQMVRFGLGENIAVIAGSGGLGDQWFKLVEWAESHGKVADLLSAATSANRTNPDLQAAANALRGGASGSATEDPFDVMCSLLPAQLEEVIFRSGIPRSHLSTGAGATCAAEIVRWSRQSARNEAALTDALRRVTAR